ncbi:MAG: sigma 54-interacting transcriptional regulator [Pseudobdellovibrionaceae bacterium]|nr:sigma 54-interacting transcriptional regulator [Pseudobdellovibrionaceae bacterium]
MNASCQTPSSAFDRGLFRTRRSESSLETDASLLKGIVLPSNLVDLARKIAKNPSLPTLIYGETGTGKEEYAKYVHRLRGLNQPNLPFVAVNCAHLTGELALSALFGHKKGAFTGATQDSLGYVAAAQGGILFLDEVHTLDMASQKKLLRVLNDGTFQAVGATQDSHSQFQLICASTRDLDDASGKGEFLLDLWMRMVGFEVKLPPLRERLADIPALIHAFLAREKAFIPDAELKKLIKLCQGFYWQGNIRQMIRSLKVLLALNSDEGQSVRADDLPVYRSMLAPAGGEPERLLTMRVLPSGQCEGLDCRKVMEVLQTDTSLEHAVESFEKMVIQAALRRHRTVKEAVQKLGISRSTFALKRQKYGLIPKYGSAFDGKPIT